MIGQQVSHYRVLEKLGEGGMGVVYKAEDVNLRRLVALKFLSSKGIGAKEDLARFRREAQAAAALDHPNVCAVYEIGEHKGDFFIAMAYVDGETFRDKIAAAPLKLHTALDLAIQAAEGLNAAHAKGIVHRDIKASNVMLASDGRVQIMDFGLAKTSESTRLTQAGTTAGTIAYMSPEQARGEDVDHRTDIWSFAVLLFEMLTGQTPFKGQHDQAIIYAVLNTDPEPLTALRSGIPLELELILRKAMAKAPDERYQHMDELIVDLRAVRAQVESGTTTILAPSISRLQYAAAAKRRRRTLTAVLAIVAVAVLAFVAVKLLQHPTPRTEVTPNAVAVAVFENQTGDASLDPIGQMAADGIIAGLAQTDLVQVVPMLRTLSASQVVAAEGATDPATQLQRLATETGAGVVVSGAYYLHADSLRFRAMVTDVTNGKLMHALSAASGSPEAPMEAIETLKQQIMGSMVSRFGPFSIICAGSQPPRFEAYEEYVVGLTLFAQDYPEVLRHFARAAELDPDFLSPRIFTILAHLQQGRYATADSTLTAFKRGSQRIPPYAQLFLNYLSADIEGSYAEALRTARQMGKMKPNDRAVNYLTGLMALRLNRPRETVDTFQRMGDREDALGFAWEAGRFGNWANAHNMLGEHDRELDVLRHAGQYFPDKVWIKIREVRALVAMKRLEEARQSVDQTVAMASTYWTRDRILRDMAEVYRGLGYIEESRDLIGHATTSFEIHRSDQSRRSRLEYAFLLFASERWTEARDIADELLPADPHDLSVLSLLGSLAARLGHREEAIAISTRLENDQRPYLYGDNMYACACISAQLGEHDRAMEFLRDAFARGFRSYFRLKWDMDLEPLRNEPEFKELLRPAG